MQRFKYYICSILLGLTLFSVCYAEGNGDDLAKQTIMIQTSSYAKQLYTYSYDNYQDKINQQANNFLLPAFQKFTGIIKQPDYINFLVNEKIVITADISGDVKVIANFTEENNNIWQVQVPIHVFYYGPRLTGEQYLNVELFLQQNSQTGDVKIEQFNVQPLTKLSWIDKPQTRLAKCGAK